MPTYAEFDPITQGLLTNPDDDDTYRRPIFSLVDDDDVDDHEDCLICQTNRHGMRWVPNNGGAWVASGIWERCERDPERYILATSHWADLVF